jgi:NADH-quinone oxidoreductase E subunit
MLSDKARATLADVLTHYPADQKASAVIYALYLAQQEGGYITEEAAREVANLLEMDPTEVLGVVGFYTLLYEHPVGKYMLHYCNDMPCALRGADQFLGVLESKLGIRAGETTADGLFTIDPVMCIGACHRAPCMQVNLEFQEFLTEEKLDRLLEMLRRGETVRSNMAADAEPTPSAPLEFGGPTR